MLKKGISTKIKKNNNIKNENKILLSPDEINEFIELSYIFLTAQAISTIIIKQKLFWTSFSNLSILLYLIELFIAPHSQAF